MSGNLEQWLGIGDLDELVREVDRRCDAGDWAGVEQVRFRSRAAIERGHQLWPASSYAEYRLALDAPADWAAAVITDESGYMALGPLTEVVAQGHTWAELAPHLGPSARRSIVAQERVIRGEVIGGDEGDDDPGAGELPGRLLAWEPPYALAEYTADAARFPAPEIAAPIDMVATVAGDPSPDAADGAHALVESVRHWSSHSEGTVRAVGVEGGALDALGALGHERVRLRECTSAEAGSLLAWAAADGGAHGRRRGAATGRFELWWALAVLAGVDDRWPLDPGPDAARLRYGLWLPDAPVTGWSCRLTVADDEDGLAWALDASDASDAPGGD